MDNDTPLPPRANDPAVTTDDYIFAIIPEWVLDAGVSDRAKVLYCTLRRYVGANEAAWPSRRRLSERMRCGLRTIDRAVEELESIGACRVIRRVRYDGSYSSSAYHLAGGEPVNSGHRGTRDLPHDPIYDGQLDFPDGAGVVPRTAQGVVRPTAQGVVRPVAHQERESGERQPVEREPPYPPTEALALVEPKGLRPTGDDTFDTFWALYPRRAGKVAAMKAWKVALQRTGATTILMAVQRFAADPNREDQFTPHPATWLNQGRWDDDPLPARGQTAKVDPLAGGAARLAATRLRGPYIDTKAEVSR